MLRASRAWQSGASRSGAIRARPASILCVSWSSAGRGLLARSGGGPSGGRVARRAATEKGRGGVRGRRGWAEWLVAAVRAGEPGGAEVENEKDSRRQSRGETTRQKTQRTR